MKDFYKFCGIAVMIAIIGFLLTGCAKKSAALSAPSNIRIDITGRTVTVTWDAVAKASGYEIITYSEGCGSGKRKINTKENTAVVFNPDNTANDGKDALKKDKSSGAVEILSKTKIQITLMPSSNDNTKPMAKAITAKVKALGTIDSDYSAAVRKELNAGMAEM